MLGEDFDDPTTNVFMEKCFRRLFGVPRFIFLNLVEKAMAESWFGEYMHILTLIMDFQWTLPGIFIVFHWN